MTQEFIKEKLSRKAIDEIARRNMDVTNPKAFLYTLANGERIPVSAYNIIILNGGAGEAELSYLLGQTYPYHHIESYSDVNFPAQDLIFDKDRKPWGPPNDATALLMLAMNSRVINLIKGPKGPLVLYDGLIKPVIHYEDEDMNG